MTSCKIFMHGVLAGELRREESGGMVFLYERGYDGPPVSVTLPVRRPAYHFSGFPPYFEGLLPEGANLEIMVQHHKLEREDHLSQLAAIGGNLVGAITAERGE